MSGVIGSDGIQRERCACGKFFKLVDEIYEKKTEQLPYGESMCFECFNRRINEILLDEGYDSKSYSERIDYIKNNVFNRFELPTSVNLNTEEVIN